MRRKSPALLLLLVVLPRQQKATGFARGCMRQRLAGMSPHWDVKNGATGYARGAPLACHISIPLSLCHF
jgi:hypothetical protein